MVIAVLALTTTAFGQGLDPELAGGGAGDEPAGPDVPSEPLHVLVSAGAGTSLRIVKNLDFQQDLVAPGFVDLMGGVLLPGSGTLRHGLVLGVAMNLSGDGSSTPELGVDPAQQFVLAPGYMMMLRPSPVPDLLAFFKGSVGFTLSPDFSPGLELSAGGAFMLFAGVGLYAELAGALYVGAATEPEGPPSYHPIVSIDGGIFIDYEVLP